MSDKKITADMGIMDVVQQYPQTVEVFASFGLSCLGCAAARFENLGQGAGAHGIDLDELLEALNNVVD